MTTHDPGNDRFDQAMRATHADALAHVSAATMAQLHRRRHAALSVRPARGLRWPLPAAAFASLLVVAVGLGFGLRMSGEAPPAPVDPAIAAVAAGAGIEDALDDLDQNPDFYVWLASGDADLLAME
ncbi:alanine:cation symporter family protein [Luteimonas marina]|uniref:Alanine:cation symporter family protein n=1 Tax=Luteimonas marina TaxID=488485 RepID=A0A5C5U5R2_9GAMM|nr:alanine:cation symporter family protein [Luteimonas marina]TWT21284.1 alanine:cation symporter family protein [Luteimonas marina]